MNTLPKLQIEQFTSYKTDETYSVTNEEFMTAVFNELQEARPIVVTFRDSPATAAPKCWFGRPWGTKVSLPPSTNNYFSLAVFCKNDNGRYYRKKEAFHSLYAVYLDDVGSKVNFEQLSIRPTWLLETSAGNYQAGYLLDKPLTDAGTADSLMKAIINAGLCDPGAGGPCARLARLPLASNSKSKPPFPCRMAQWNPNLRYSVEDLVNGFQLEMLPTQSRRSHAKGSTDKSAALSDQVWFPAPNENVVIEALRKRGIYKNPLGSGKHDITCPWVEEHTNAIDKGTAYFEPSDSWLIGGFKCLHGHCANRRIADLLSYLSIDAAAARMKPIIRIIPGEISCMADAAELALAPLNMCYQRSGSIVEVITDPATQDTRIQPISQNALLKTLARAITWERFDSRANGWIRTDPSAKVNSILFDAGRYQYLPVIKGLTRQPYLHENGALVYKSGYETSTGIFGVFDTTAFKISSDPSRQDAETALGELNDLLSEFAFASEVDKSAAVAALLTAAVRPSLSTAPMFHVRAHTMGTGKSYLCALITAFATPRRGAPIAFPSLDEECSKLLLAELLGAPAVIEFDNLTHDLTDHRSLCSALTAGFLTGRILGLSKTAAVPTRSLFLSSGNNVGPIKDMTRRCITINLDAGTELPANRRFKRPDLVGEVLNQREHYVSAALTIIRAWIVSGRPLSDCQGFGSYGGWSDLCRQPLLWLGCSDPTVSVSQTIHEDPDRELLGRLLLSWQQSFGCLPTMIREALQRCAQNGCGELKELLEDIAEERGEINRRKLGQWIKRHAGQIIDDLRFVKSNVKSSSEKWRVESVSQSKTNRGHISAEDSPI
ncbi:MAG TPA: hypothetical protein VIZ65_01795 [Cellvibrionaceae bacterium]